MKKVKIGETEYSQIETLFDISDKRFVTFKQYLLQVFEHMDNPLFEAMFKRYVKFYDGGQHADALIELYNFKKSLELAQEDHDAKSFCFCLLHLAPGENQNETGSSYQLAKLKSMRDAGLSRSTVEDVVENFIKASPDQFGVYLQAQEMMRLRPLEDSSSDLSDLGSTTTKKREESSGPG